MKVYRDAGFVERLKYLYHIEIMKYLKSPTVNGLESDIAITPFFIRKMI